MNTQQSTLTDSSCPDCSAFLNWTEETLASNDEIGNIFRFLIATVKLQPALDASLEAKAVELLNYVVPDDEESECTFLDQFASSSDDSLIDFILSIVVLLSSPSQTITTKSMKILDTLFHFCSEKVHLALVKADLIPQLINTLNPQTLSFAEGVDIHTRLIYRITHPFWLATPNNLKKLGIKDDYEQQAVHETILKQVLAPSEEYIRHLCVNRFSIVDGHQSMYFLMLLANILRISPSYQSIMEIVLRLPVFLTIPSCLAFFENDDSIWLFLSPMTDAQLEWNKKGGEIQQMGTTMQRMLRMEGIDDVIEEKLHNDKTGYGRAIALCSIDWNNLQGMNLSKRR